MSTCNSRTEPELKEVTLKAKSRVGKAIGFFIIGLVLGGGAVFLYIQVKAQSGTFALIPGFFMCAVAAVSLICLIAAVICFLEIFNPTVSLQLLPSSVELGQAGMLSWQVQGKIERIRKLSIVLECRKSTQTVSYSKGKRVTHTETKILHKEDLLTVTQQAQIAQGEIGFALDPALPSTSGDEIENIRWYAIVKGEIKRWPDIGDEFEFKVYSINYAPSMKLCTDDQYFISAPQKRAGIEEKALKISEKLSF